jgi:predicted nucleic acid-binding protein
MIFVLDASVAIAAARPAEVAHRRARSVVDRILRGDDSIVVPSLFGIEVVAGLARRGHDAAGAEAFVDALLAPPSEAITIGPVRAAMIRRTAAASRLRAADACYVWTAQRRGLALCTLDADILARSVGIRVYAP